MDVRESPVSGGPWYSRFCIRSNRSIGVVGPGFCLGFSFGILGSLWNVEVRIMTREQIGNPECILPFHRECIRARYHATTSEE